MTDDKRCADKLRDGSHFTDWPFKIWGGRWARVFRKQKSVTNFVEKKNQSPKKVFLHFQMAGPLGVVIMAQSSCWDLAEP